MYALVDRFFYLPKMTINVFLILILHLYKAFQVSIALHSLSTSLLLLIIYFHVVILFYNSWKMYRGPCSTNCGTGVARQNISCTLTDRRSTREVDVRYCEKHSADIGPKPAEHVVCHGKCLETQWSFSEWTEV